MERSTKIATGICVALAALAAAAGFKRMRNPKDTDGEAMLKKAADEQVRESLAPTSIPKAPAPKRDKEKPKGKKYSPKNGKRRSRKKRGKRRR